MNAKEIFLTVGISLIASVASAQSYAINWHTIGAGGTSTGGIYSVSATIGEMAAGPMSGGGYTMDSGFWSAYADPAELIVNGSFENTRGTFVQDANNFMSLPAGSTVIPGWTTATAELAWLNNTNSFGAVTPSGAFCLDLTGYHDLGAYAAVFQNIATTPGGNYRLSLALGAYASSPGTGGQKKVFVTAGSASTNFIFNSNLDWPTNTGNLWSTFTFNFTATAASTEVMILGVPDANTYLALDNVSVTPILSAPLPPLRIIGVEKLGGDLRLSFTSAVGKNYAIQSRATVEFGEWTTLAGTTNAGNGGTVQSTVTNALTQPQQFYRVWQLP